MKQFISRSLIFLFLSAVLYHIKPLYLLYKNKYQQTTAGSEIYFCIDKSKKKSKSKKLLIGDSVAKQLFDSKTNYDTVNSLTCNQAISLVGQYLFLHNYLQAGNQPDTVYLIYRPFSFENNLDQQFTYHYFIKPFYKKENKPFLTETVNRQIEKIPYHQFAWYPSILTSNWAPDYVSKDKRQFSLLSPLSVEYLKKIQDLEKMHHFKLIILPTPMSEKTRVQVELLNQAEIASNGLTDEFKGYFDNIIYVEDSKFKDGVHFHNPEPYTAYYRKHFLRY